MKRLIISLFAIGTSLASQAQERRSDIEVPEGYILVDTVVYRTSDVVDKNLKGSNVFDVLNYGDGQIRVVQDIKVREGMNRHVESNRDKKLAGYRVRIFFENTQDARTASEDAVDLFERKYPGYNTYRTFSNPFFKVTVGDFRTKSEALVLLGRLTGTFPSATVVKEKIEFPQASSKDTYSVDTIQVLRPIQ